MNKIAYDYTPIEIDLPVQYLSMFVDSVYVCIYVFVSVHLCLYISTSRIHITLVHYAVAMSFTQFNCVDHYIGKYLIFRTKNFFFSFIFR